MKTLLLLLLCFCTVGCSFSQESIRWDLDSLDKTGGNATTVYGSPTLITTYTGQAIEFDGVDDALFVSYNPMQGLTEFTIEAIFKPYSGGNFEQRWVHFQQNDDNRILLELRYAKGSWYLDTYIKSGTSSRTLIDTNKIHDIDKWYHVALVYKNGTMTHFVDGIPEATGAVSYTPVSNGQTSLGVRQTMVNYFKGAIKTVKITSTALDPNAFITSEAEELNAVATSIKQTSNTRVKLGSLFPHPAKESTKMAIQFCAGQEMKLTLTNSQGATVLAPKELLVTNDYFELEIPRADLPSGIYFLSLQNGRDLFSRTVVFE